MRRLPPPAAGVALDGSLLGSLIPPVQIFVDHVPTMKDRQPTLSRRLWQGHRERTVKRSAARPAAPALPAVNMLIRRLLIGRMLRVAVTDDGINFGAEVGPRQVVRYQRKQLAERLPSFRLRPAWP